MEEPLWYIQQQSRVLREFQESIQLLWDDEASRTISRSILIPHQEDDEQMREGFVYQQHQLGENKTHREIALSLSREALEMSEQILHLIHQIDEDIEISIQFHQQYRSFYAEAQGMLPEVDQLLATAMKIGNGDPSYEP